MIRSLCLAVLLLPFIATAGPPPAKGTVEVVSTPPGLDILVNGEATSRRTPGYADVPAGKPVEISVRSGGSVKSRSVTVRPGQVIRLRFELKDAAAPPSGPPPSPTTAHTTGEYEIPQEITDSHTEWFSIHGLFGASTQGEAHIGYDVAFFTLRWPGIYWDILHAGVTFGGDAGISFFGGTALGYSLTSQSGRHEMRVGTALGFGQAGYGSPVDIPAGYRLKSEAHEVQVAAQGFAIKPHLTYIYHVARSFSVELGITILIPFHEAVADVALCGSFSYGECKGADTPETDVLERKMKDEVEQRAPGFLGDFYLTLGIRI